MLFKEIIKHGSKI